MSEFQERLQEVISSVSYSFLKAKTFEEALSVAWNKGDSLDKYVAHYTTVEGLMAIVSTGRWRLTRNTANKLNDQQEYKKFGSKEKAEHIFQASFAQGVRESVAEWVQYGKNNALAIKLLFPIERLKKWVNGLNEKGIAAEFKDILYASIPNKGKRDEFDKKRGCSLVWRDLSNYLPNCQNLPEILQDEKMTGLVKDIEWSHEHERRLIVYDQSTEGDFKEIDIPRNLLSSVSITFSPWLRRGSEKMIRDVIKDFAEKHSVKITNKKFHRSTLSGALNMK